MKFSTIMIVILASVIAHSANASTYYRWVDKNGSTHYTKTPPPKGAKLIGKTETYAVPVYKNSPQNTYTNVVNEPSAPVYSTPVQSTPKNLAMTSSNYVPPVSAPSHIPATPSVQQGYRPAGGGVAPAVIEVE